MCEVIQGLYFWERWIFYKAKIISEVGLSMQIPNACKDKDQIPNVVRQN